MGKSEVFLGVGYGPSKIRLGLLERDGRIQQETVLELKNCSTSGVIPYLTEVIGNFLQEQGGIRPTAIGIGLPGYINPEKGIWMHCLSMGVRSPIALVPALREEFGVPVYIDNDLNAATLAENYFGIGRICRDFLFAAVDEGVAMGIVADGRLIRGVANCAGELGHVMAESGGELCACNSHGCLENIVSSSGLVTQAKRQAAAYPNSPLCTLQEITTDDIFRCAQAGDELSLRLAHRAVCALGIGLVNSINLLNPEHIVVSGSVCRNAWFVDQVRRHVYANGFVSSVATLKELSHSNINPKHIEILGAASLCFVPM